MPYVCDYERTIAPYLDSQLSNCSSTPPDSSHRGTRTAERLRERWPNLRLVHVPVRASWLNQVEIYFSVVQRKVLTPNDFADLAKLMERLSEKDG
jgi:hypothetical protein